MIKYFNLCLESKRLWAIILGSALFFTSCKENTILPPDLVPVIDNINTFESDTFSLITRNVYQDSILTGGSVNGVRKSNDPSLYHALGAITKNPDFGYTHASFHTEVVPPTSSYTHKGYDPIFDSIVLSIPFISTFGDTINAEDQDLLVYRSLKSFPRDSSQYEFTKDSFDFPRPIAAKTINFNQYRKDSASRTVRFKLASWVADSLKAQMDLLSTGGATSSYAKFLDWWKGFYVTSISSQGNTLGFFNTYGTKMLVYYRYYKDSANTDIDTTLDVFGFDPSICNRFNTIERRYAGASAQNYYPSSTLKGDSQLYVQNQPGLATEIQFPHLANFGNYIVNKAELNLFTSKPVNELMDTTLYGLIPRMQVFRLDAGKDKIINEYISFGAGFIDAKRYEVTIMGYKYIGYRILLTETIQNLISKKDTAFRLKVMGLSDSYPGGFGSILKGNTTLVDSLRPKLYMIYTKLN